MEAAQRTAGSSDACRDLSGRTEMATPPSHSSSTFTCELLKSSCSSKGARNSSIARQRSSLSARSLYGVSPSLHATTALQRFPSLRTNDSAVTAGKLCRISPERLANSRFSVAVQLQCGSRVRLASNAAEAFASRSTASLVGGAAIKDRVVAKIKAKE